MSVEHHGLEAVTPQDLIGQVGGPGLEGQARRLDGALHGDVQLEVGGGQVSGAHPYKES